MFFWGWGGGKDLGVGVLWTKGHLVDNEGCFVGKWLFCRQKDIIWVGGCIGTNEHL